jgi:DNA-binding HxlR family transcriptional regulator
VADEPLICPSVEGAFNLLAHKWMGLVVHVLATGPRRFCELEREIPGVSARLLTERVKELENEGIITRSVSADRPVRVVYELTEKGRGLVPVVRGLAKWARSWSATPNGRAGA